ncbi:MAG: ATPase [Gammaproteobacteria bacterium]|nr:ATPase [Gammaproteobacteria bacterium]
MSKEFTKAQDRQDRRIREHIHDPYMTRAKPKEPSVCGECGVVFEKGKWRWGSVPEGAHEMLCPACQRVRDRVPAGYVFLGGPFFEEHREEIVRRAHNVEEREKKERPLKRIMGVEEQDDGIVVTTTDIHLARTIGDALHDAWEGELDYQYTEETNLLEVTWRR